ncbi:MULTISPECIES: plasmid stabilization protein [Nitrosomonas]|uniref:Putative plasmid stability protein n=1 Tax=Nitrosomonas europaea (strain ATCC 19718 / CIP 103999 / KCTC 2705 / NBRC 14298) TaxID=228410 RepID=Q82VL4_NITEU|nr:MULTISPECIES: plasmid stabilization protein [Nitrosomonas]MCE7917257.1 plasmid stabilization protein [Nitrosomonas sp. PRO5]MDL1865556.1 plasmid stabilization protein [Betaproteobacteria bacterium PRO5]MDF0678813.1 plasmid stabilization protein [Nitrosomonas sp.]MEB2332366.1 plasmid stabilization protein [Nitrosomonas sp.]QOJ08881.1 MAG: plasmid stabilization protein [Nitrosomonas sp. H1_AOB3]
MATMTIRNIDEQLKARLRVRAAMHGRSMEDEVQDILRTALSAEPVQTVSLVEVIRSRIEPLGGIELNLPEREAIRDPLEPGA